MCGVANFATVEDSYYVIDTAVLPAQASDCEEVYMENGWATPSTDHKLRVLGMSVDAECRYDTREICRAPLDYDEYLISRSPDDTVVNLS